MRRVLALLLMLIVPIQLALALEQGVHDHDRKDLVQWGYHAHLQDSHHDHEHASGAAFNGIDHDGTNHQDDGHHGNHYHPVFSSLIADPGPSLVDTSPSGLAARPPASFISHIPPLFERPPAVL